MVLKCRRPVSYTVRLDNGLVGTLTTFVPSWGNQSSKMPPPTSSTSISLESTEYDLEVPLPSTNQEMLPPVSPSKASSPSSEDETPRPI